MHTHTQANSDLLGWCTLICSVGGTLILDFLLKTGTLSQQLLHIPELTEEAIAPLIDPADHQNIPKAVKLLQSIVSILSLPTSDLDPTEGKVVEMITFIGVILQSLVEPFTNVELSLTEQLEHLSTYTHLSFVMFHLHRTSFSSNQLYADCQAMIKSAYFSVAKQQLLD
jgi:hypothetical protein